jgi:hypothetical protein
MSTSALAAGAWSAATVPIAEQLVDLDQVITLVSDAVAEGVSESR